MGHWDRKRLDRAGIRPRLSSTLVHSGWMLLLGLVAARAGAATGVIWRNDASQYNQWQVSSIRIQGLPGSLAAELKPGLSLAVKHGLFRKGPPFRERALEDDVDRTRLFLAQRGYPEARIEVRIQPNAGKERLDLVIDITPGEPVVVTEFSISGVPERLVHQAGSSAGFKPGSVFDDASVQAAAQRVSDLLQRNGYAEAKVEIALHRLNAGKVSVEFAVTPGEIHYFRHVLVSGLPSDLTHVVRRTIHIRRGSRFQPGKIQRADERLTLLDLFTRSQVQATMIPPDSVDVVAALTRRNSEALQVGGGYFTDELWKGNISWTRRDIFTHGRSLTAAGSYSMFNQNVTASTRWPDFGEQLVAEAQTTAAREVEKSFNLTDTELDLSGTYTSSLHLSLQLGVALSRIIVHIKQADSLAFESRGGTLTDFFVHWNRNDADNPLNPTRGYVSTADVEWAPVGFGPPADSHYILGEVTGTAYFSLPGAVVAAAHVDAGAANPLGKSTDLLPNKRFYAGGEKSMRGFHRHLLGPLDPTGAPLGGDALLLGSVELRVPLFWLLRAAGFADAGQVWSRPILAKSSEIEVAVGPGLMVETPVGPIRADYAHRITHFVNGQPANVLQLSIGEPF